MSAERRVHLTLNERHSEASNVLWTMRVQSVPYSQWGNWCKPCIISAVCWSVVQISGFSTMSRCMFHSRHSTTRDLKAVRCARRWTTCSRRSEISMTRLSIVISRIMGSMRFVDGSQLFMYSLQNVLKWTVHRVLTTSLWDIASRFTRLIGGSGW